MSDTKVAGLAKQMREQTEKHEEYDLDNYSEEAAMELMRAAFGAPLEATEPVRCTLVCGGGKSVRGRYDPNLMRGISQSLKALGFEEDSGASLGTQGAFKMQHDTGRNLKLAHVFPRTSAGEGAASGDGAGGASGATLDPEAPAYQLMAAESLEAFQQLTAAHLPTYVQKARAAKELSGTYLPLFKAIDAKLVGAQPLDAGEEAWSAVCSADALSERLASLQQAMMAQVEKGDLTAADKAEVRRTMGSKLESLEAEIAAAKSEGKAKRAEKLEATRAQIAALRAAADECSPKPPHQPQETLQELAGLWRQILALRHVEARAKQENKLLSLEQARQVGQLPELEEKVAAVLERECGWYETAKEVGERLAAGKQHALAQQKKAQAQQAARAGANAGWSTVGQPSKQLGAKPKAKGSSVTGGSFALLGDD